MRRGRERVKVGTPSFRSPGHRLCAVQSTIVLRVLVALGMVLASGACAAAAPATPPIVAGAADAPREVNLIAKDYAFLPDALDLVPGETVLLHVINGGLEIHEAILGDMAVQDAWEVAEAATIGAPPGPTPLVSVPPEVSGLRIVVRSGERVDVVWTVPDTTARFIVGCHIPGHWQKGMQIPVRWVAPTSTTPGTPAP